MKKKKKLILKEKKNSGTNINIEGNTWIDDEQLEINTNV